MAIVTKRHLLIASGDDSVELLKYGCEFFDERLPLGIDALSIFCHHFFVDVHDVGIGLFFCLEHGVALL